MTGRRKARGRAPRRIRGALARPATMILVLLVLAGSAAAFAISEGLKVQKAAITAVHVGKIFSPVCDCPTDRVSIAFRLTRSDRLTVGVVDSHGQIVRTLVGEQAVRAGQASLHLERAHQGRGRRAGRHLRAAYPPPPRREDARPPQPDHGRHRAAADRGRVGPPARDLARRRRPLGRRARPLPHRRARARPSLRRTGSCGPARSSSAQSDTIDWYGRVEGSPLPPGTLSPLARSGRQRRQLLESRSRRERSRSGTSSCRRRCWSRSRARASRRARSPPTRRRCTTSCGAARAPSPPGRRRAGSSFRAPAKPGRYTLVVGAAGHRARAVLVVAKR